MSATAPRFCLFALTLGDGAVPVGIPMEQECAVAITDLLERNHFAPNDSPGGPYHLHLRIAENRLIFDVRLADDSAHGRVTLALISFRRIVKDYFLICESYYAALGKVPPSKIKAIDMGRRGLHDEGSRFLMERLKSKIDVDFATGRRLFTLICALHLRR